LSGTESLDKRTYEVFATATVKFADVIERETDFVIYDWMERAQEHEDLMHIPLPLMRALDICRNWSAMYNPITIGCLNKGPDLEEFRRLIGNTKLLIIGIVLAWVLAAFGEETVWRGYLMNRCADIFGRSTIGWSVAAILISFLFGLAHFPQGPTGIIENIIDGAILAAIYFATGRNLWAPIIAHGIQDTVDVLLIYFGVYPGLRSELALF